MLQFNSSSLLVFYILTGYNFFLINILLFIYIIFISETKRKNRILFYLFKDDV